MAEGNRHLGYKEALNAIEERSPGTKHDFYFGFLDRAADRFIPVVAEERGAVGSCVRCGAPANGEICAFCRLVERAGGRAPEVGTDVALLLGRPPAGGVL